MWRRSTDEVYSRLALVAEGEISQKNFCEGETGVGEDEMEGGHVEKKPRMMPHMFCKTLTASDTSTHGGFSVPRRAAEDCFPPLDYKQLRPSQELIAKDLHGTKWSFRHIYRGQPRRHLLTTGWSSFVNKKKPVLGDAVLFLRGDDGLLRLGVKRAVKLRNEALSESVNSTDSKLRTLSAVSSSLKNGSIFHVCFDPRIGASEFIVPYRKFLKCLNYPFSIGMWFKITQGNEDANERSSGLISGISDVDSIRWPGSKWRCLLVRWDDGINGSHENRVSPWEIARVGGTIAVTHCLSVSSSKQTKLYLPQGNLEAPIINSMETEKFRRVLQGQELMGSRTHGVTCSQSPDAPKFQTPEHRRFSADARSCMLNGPTIVLPQQNAECTYQPVGLGESVRFPEVLQGQEMSQVVPFFQGTTFGNGSHTQNDRISAFNYARGTAAPQLGLSAPTEGYPLRQFTLSAASSPSSVLIFNQAAPQLELEGRPRPNHKDAFSGQGWQCVQCQMPSEAARHQLDTGKASTPADAAESGSATREAGRSDCKLFGFSLTENMHGATEEAPMEGRDDDDDRRSSPVLELSGHNGRFTPGALRALCAAALGAWECECVMLLLLPW